MNRCPLLVANWKMAMQSLKDVENFINTMKQYPWKDTDGIEIGICPSAFHLGAILNSSMKDLPGTSNVFWGGQDIHWEKKGAYTGCISGAELADGKARYAIIGHSERRKYFKEDNEILKKKLTNVFESGLVPIFCIGETKEERESGKTFDVLKDQVDPVLSEIKPFVKDASRFVLAYEPVWAIGTGIVATTAQAQEAHKYLRERLKAIFGEESAKGIRILYGGSVTPDNFADLSSQPDIDGGLVGGASLKVDSFLKLAQILAKTRGKVKG
ncbi:triose-phosphate isomerase [Elusimicrobiota bacterium]